MKGDWVDSSTGKVYDGCSPPDTRHFDKQMSNGNYQKSLLSHVNNSNVDYVVIDTTGLNLTQAQAADLNSVISRLTAQQQAKIVRIP
jgi:ABC-type enterochelin transport system ATPase subunit